MYAEEFNAPSWLERPSQWLWWAFQEKQNGNIENAQYNLGQFWAALNEVKSTATDATWPEILALDAQSHIQQANIISSTINSLQQGINTVSSIAGIFGLKSDLAREGADITPDLQDMRTSELEVARLLATQARTATAGRVASVASGRLSQDVVEKAKEKTDIEKIMKNTDAFEFLGMPMKTWAIGAAALYLLLLVKR